MTRVLTVAVSTLPLPEGQADIWPLTLHWVDAATFPMSNTSRVSGLEAAADVVRRYFEHDADREIDSIIALFSDDATVVDEGETRRGTTAIRAWQTGQRRRDTRARPMFSAPARSPQTASWSRAG